MGDFSKSKIKEIWNKGVVLDGYDSEKYRLDACGAIMQFDLYGDTNSIYGWNVDHILAIAKGGTDELSNLRPMQHQNNTAKSDGKLVCVVKFDSKQSMNVKL